MDKTENKKSINDFGKFGLINHLTRDVKTGNKSTLTGIGDDSAVIDSGKKLTLVLTDLLLEGIHFNLIYTPLKHLGYKAVTLTELKKEEIRPTSMIDVTDGLASDLLHVCRLSDTGCRIYNSKIPIDYETSRLAEEFNIDPLVPALNGGEDFEMLFTVPLEMVEKIKMVQSVKVIGHMTSYGSGYYITGDNGSEVEISAQGWKE